MATATATVTPDTAPDQRERTAGGAPPVLRLAGYDDYDGYDGSEREAAGDGDWHICRGID
ncbi:hypothetical protein [Streptomyces xinghaiensis]|uniref:hypothetical protein n=1 Tax=Streptomyces xinghaiensis TaxID=1038928 RepID=UPI00343D0FF4